MAFPTVINTANTTSTGSASLALTMPASIVAGRLLLAISDSQTDDAATTAMTGWTKLGATERGASGTGTLAAFAKIAAGSDTGTVTGTSGQRCVTCYQIDAWSGVIADIGHAGATSASLDPPNLTRPSALDYLWIAAVKTTAAGAVTGAPASYTNLVAVTSGSTLKLGTARRNLNAASDNPGVFSGSAGDPVGMTVAIAPASAPPTVNTSQFLPFFM